MIKNIFLTSLFLLLLGGCQPEDPGAPLVQIGAKEISLDQFQAETGHTLDAVTEQSAEEQQLLQRRLLAQMIDRELILLEAEKRGMQISPTELEAALVDLRGSNTPEEFQEVLKTSGQNPEQWSERLRLRLLTEKVAEHATAATAQVSDEEVTDYYRKNLETFRRPAQLRARQIMLATQEDAEQTLGRLEAGEDFAALAKEVSLSPDRENGGDLGFFSRNQLPSEFDEALFKLPVGRVSEPVTSPYGFHLFLVEEKRKAGLEPLESVRTELAEQLHRDRKEQAFAKWLQELRQQTPVSIDWTQLQPKS